MTDWTSVLRRLGERGFEIERGMSDEELAALEDKLGTKLPADLHTLLATGVPRGEGFPPWRTEPAESLRSWMADPVNGVLFDVEHNSLWLTDWGERPANPDQALAIAREQLAQAPPLIPLYRHRYLPAEPAAEGNPVFSVHQSDVVVYGRDLEAYLAHEFGLADATADGPTRHIRFWSDLLL